jgi:predicted outer membrane repeat protein
MFRFARVLVVMLLVLALGVGPAQAAPASGVVGDGTPDSCTEAALDAALSGGGVVTFNCGGPKTILVLSQKNITQETTIDGDDAITLTGGLATGLFRVDAAGSLTLKDIILDSAYNVNTSGGAIWSAGPLTLTHVTIQNSQTGSQFCGGALLAAGDAVITNSTFNKNNASLGGGAICVRSQPGTKVQITDSSFFNNQAVDAALGYGGALYVEYGTAIVRDSVFLSNSAHFGGAVYTARDNAATTLKGSASSSPYASKMQLNANAASEDGGAIYNKGGAISIDSAVITVNRTPTQTALAGYGGGIYNEGVLTLTNSILSQNEGRYGGGVFIGNNPTGASAMIEHTSFLSNVSGNLGGGLYTNLITTTLTVSDTVFIGNSARAGGGLARSNSDLHVFNSSFTQNTADLGGGLLLSAVPSPTSGPYVRVQSVTVSGNTATSNQGGGVFNEGLVELYSMTIVSNTNGVFSRGLGNTRFRDSVLQNPGSLNCDGDGTAQISDDSHNFSTDNSCPLPNSQVGLGLDPKLAPLTSDNFGITYYHMPFAGSPLINAAFNCPERDQRGALRPDACDIGAVEFGGLLRVAYLPLLVTK